MLSIKTVNEELKNYLKESRKKNEDYQKTIDKQRNEIESWKQQYFTQKELSAAKD